MEARCKQRAPPEQQRPSAIISMGELLFCMDCVHGACMRACGQAGMRSPSSSDELELDSYEGYWLSLQILELLGAQLLKSKRFLKKPPAA